MGGLSIAVLFAVSGVLLAQSATQTIQGLVTDSSGAVVAGAKVTITNLSTRVSLTSISNQSGLYSIQLVPVGDYEVRCEMQGFKTETVRDIRVETAAQVRQDFHLVVGNITETVEVSAEAPLLETTTASG